MSVSRVKLIETVQLCRLYNSINGTVEALRDINLCVERGEFLALSGPSGSGKTTLLNILSGLDQPTAGVYRFDGVNLPEAGDAACARIRATRIGIVFQMFNLIPDLTAEENVRLPLLYAGHSGASRRASEVLDYVDLTSRRNHFPAQLSGGEMQRVAMARAIACKPELLLADEPTGNLDADNAHCIIELLNKIRNEGCTILVVTHDHTIAASADRVMEIRYGRLSAGKSMF